MSLFNIQTLQFDAFPIREFPHGTWSPDDRLKVVVNKYTPHNNPHPKDGDVTIICAHANGFHKELYEPFFDYLVEDLDKLGVKIRAIWAPDMFHQGASGVVNEKKLGGQISWFDHCRDILSIISQNPTEFQAPLVGIGHSMGGCILFRTSLIHRTLFAGLVGLDPVIVGPTPPNDEKADAAKLSIKRRDIWPDYESAKAYFTSRPFYKTWHPRCLDLHLKYGLRKLPNAIYPDQTGYTLTTTKHMEVLTFVGQDLTSPYGREMFRLLPEITSPVLYVQGETSFVNHGAWGTELSSNDAKMKRTPKPCEMYVMKGVGHLVPMDEPEKTANVVAPWMSKTLKKWIEDREAEKKLYPPTLTVPPTLVGADVKYKL